MRIRRSPAFDLLWWFLSALAGFGLARLGQWVVSLETVPDAVTVLAALVLAPSVLGFLKPDKPWRWAIAFFVGYRLATVRSLHVDTTYGPWVVVAPWALLFFFRALPLNLAGVYLGYFLNRKRRKPEMEPYEWLSQHPRIARVAAWGGVFAVGVGLSGFMTAGFIGPMILEPTAQHEQAPLAGLLITPAAAVIGLILGLTAAAVGVLSDSQLRVLAVGAVVATALAVFLFMLSVS